MWHKVQYSLVLSITQGGSGGGGKGDHLLCVLSLQGEVLGSRVLRDEKIPAILSLLDAYLLLIVR